MASGNTLGVLFAADAKPAASNGAGWTERNGILFLAFDASTDESADFEFLLPAHYGGGGLTFKIHWIAASATSGATRWSISAERGTTDLDSDSFATAQTAGGTANGTSGIETVTTVTMSSGANMDSAAAGDSVRLRVSRDADGTSGTDDMTGDAQLRMIEVLET